MNDINLMPQATEEQRDRLRRKAWPKKQCQQ